MTTNITGYRHLNDGEVKAINDIKALANEVGALVEELATDQFALGKGVDKRWLAIAKTELQQGFMALVRAVAQPKSF